MLAQDANCMCAYKYFASMTSDRQTDSLDLFIKLPFQYAVLFIILANDLKTKHIIK